MTKKRKTSLAIGLAAACIVVLCAAGACNGVTKEEKAVRSVIVTSVTTTSQATEPVSSTTQPTSTAPMTTTETTTAVTTTAPHITIAVICSATEQGLGEMPTPTTVTFRLMRVHGYREIELRYDRQGDSMNGALLLVEIVDDAVTQTPENSLTEPIALGDSIFQGDGMRLSGWRQIRAVSADLQVG